MFLSNLILIDQTITCTNATNFTHAFERGMICQLYSTTNTSTKLTHDLIVKQNRYLNRLNQHETIIVHNI